MANWVRGHNNDEIINLDQMQSIQMATKEILGRLEHAVVGTTLSVHGEAMFVLFVGTEEACESRLSVIMDRLATSLVD